MDSEYAKHEMDAMNAYEKKGYTRRFRYEAGTLVDLETHKGYTPQEITIVKEIRYEGMSDPEDLSILYIIETNDAIKGTFLMAYGPSADTETGAFFTAIPDENYHRE
ncbi:hypothetical protein Q4603_00185 [Zobellia galactanivorans]|uniref:hypothetical protein n=1 Tax=Zobellia galactanivorans (strain DSM 12802 / CCUG 47099 / CIP 106680 / NCIMB 13871 / Dsij) TaxID=63186 RepID=UPI0026E26F02|nr:hypothetical protein [Zobellia galactanivorans]MDO6806999.1 hypothetical protein [Zobellia galactanivorans]